VSMRPGTVVGDYRIIKLLGEGGMGQVYLAQHQTLGQHVVVKGIHRELLANAEMRGRFSREAEAMQRLSHPNIVAYYNFLQMQDGAFIVMEYVDGVTFDDLILKAGLIPPARAVELILPVLAALEFAHGRGVIHRDLKPANIMLGRDGVVRVLDFGTAKLVDRPGLTRMGTTLGTATYMPPEQLMGRELTPATDIYAIGITLYEMCTGRLPYEADDTMSLIRKVYTEPPVSPSVYYPATPKPLAEAILKCLAKSPEQRFPTARALQQAIEPIVVAARPTTPAPAVAEAPTSAGRRPSAAAAAAAPGAARRLPPATSRLPSALAAVGGAGAGLVGVLAGGGLVWLGHATPGLAVAGGAAAVWAASTGLLGRMVVGLIQREAAEAAAAAAAPAPTPAPAPAPAPAAAPASAPAPLARWTAAGPPPLSGADSGQVALRKSGGGWRHNPIDPEALRGTLGSLEATSEEQVRRGAPQKTAIASAEEIARVVGSPGPAPESAAEDAR